jgi:predicted nucleotidyltransferase
MIENMLGSLTKIRILRLFFEYPNRSFATDEVLTNSYVGRGYGGKCIKQFVNLDLLRVNKVGREKRYTLNKDNKFYGALKEFFDVEKSMYPTFSYTHKSIIGDLSQMLTEETIIVFGSVAAGTATPESDLDVLIVADRTEYVKKHVKRLEEKYRIDIQPVTLNLEKLRTLIREKSQLIRNIAREKVFISGNNEVLKMVENA